MLLRWAGSVGTAALAMIALGGCSSETNTGTGGTTAAGGGGPGGSGAGQPGGSGGTGGQGLGGSGGSGASGGTGGTGGSAPTVVTLAVDGDIAEQGRTNLAHDVAALVTSHSPAVTGVLLGGDNARYEGSGGTLLQFYQTYWKPAAEANWGQFDVMAFPQTGNHEYTETNAQGYFDYFATRFAAIAALPSYSGAAGTVGKGWYSLNIAGWHIVSLNSNCAEISGCQAGSEQESWLAGDLAAHPGMPIIAVWHAPRYTCGGAGTHGDAPGMQAMWADLYAAHADFVFSGHNHFYQRWKPLDATNPEAVQDDAAGITEIITGSGGVSTYTVCAGGDPRIAAQLGGDAAIGVLFLTIGSDGAYSYEYQLRSNGSIFDSGAGVAHNAP